MPLFNAIELYALVSEYGVQGQDTGLSAKSIFTILLGILTQLDELHKMSIVHRDIKLENILVDLKTMEIFIIDYDFCEKSGITSKIRGTPNYFHPEIIKEMQAGRKLVEVKPYDDLYAFAIILDQFIEHQLLNEVDRKYQYSLEKLSRSIKLKIAGFETAESIIAFMKKYYLSLQLQCPPSAPEQFPSLKRITKKISLKPVPGKRGSDHTTPPVPRKKFVMVWE